MKQLLRFRGCYCPNNKRPLTHKAIIVSLLLAFVIQFAQGQPSSAGRIAGTVISADTGRLLEGATITLKPGTTGVLTDEDGKFILSTNLPEGAILISYIGYQTQTVRFSPENNGPFTIRMERDENSLQEVEINAGYYTVKDRERTGSIARVDAKTIEKQIVTNPLEALKGRLAGVDIQQSSGDPGTSFNIQIRGENSLRRNVSAPLYIIDGVPFVTESLQLSSTSPVLSSSPLSAISPFDIESIEVLKDADATSIYGSRGSNGVVLITTKKSGASQTGITLNTQAGYGRVARFASLLTTPKYLEMRKEAFRNTGRTPTNANAYDLLLWDQTAQTDWQRELVGSTARNGRVQLSLNGHSGQVSYLLSGSHQRQGNVYPGKLGYDISSFHMNLGHGTQADRFSMQFSGYYSLNANRLPTNNLAAEAMALPPNAPALTDENGAITWGAGMDNNPMIHLARTYKSNARNLNSALTLNYRVLTGLQFRIQTGYNYITFTEDIQSPAGSYPPTNPRPAEVTHYVNGAQNYTLEPQLDFRKRLGTGRLQGLVGYTLNARNREGMNVVGSGFDTDQLMDNISAANSFLVRVFEHNVYRYSGFYGRLNYALKDRYFVNLTGRRDGSSRFGPDHKWGNFGAVGLAWLVSEEWKAGRAIDWLNIARLRFSYGISGSDNIGDYGYLQTYSVSKIDRYGLNQYYIPTRLSNLDYRWESNRKLEVAMDFSLFSDRLRGTVALFDNHSSNQLVGLPLPAITGFTTVQYNLPATVVNRGWEVELAASPVKGRKFSWHTTITLSGTDRTLTSYPGIEASPYYTTYQVGRTMNIARRYRYGGIDAETGLYTFSDENSDGAITEPDRVWTEGAPVRFGGISNAFSYGNVGLSFFIQVDSRDGATLLGAITEMPGNISNMPVEVMDRWQQQGDGNPVQKFWQGVGAGRTAYNLLKASDALTTRITYLRLGNLSLDWTCPARLLAKAAIKSARVTMNAQNVLTLTDYEGFDPETGGRVLPPLRNFSIGLLIGI